MASADRRDELLFAGDIAHRAHSLRAGGLQFGYERLDRIGTDVDHSNGRALIGQQ